MVEEFLPGGLLLVVLFAQILQIMIIAQTAATNPQPTPIPIMALVAEKYYINLYDFHLKSHYNFKIKHSINTRRADLYKGFTQSPQ